MNNLFKTVAHADWSVDPRKRWIAIARRNGDTWRIGTPEPVGDVATLLDRLGDDTLLGMDVPLGVPREYVKHIASFQGFPDFLRHVSADFFKVCTTLDAVTPANPFYPAKGIKGMTRDSHAQALGLRDRASLSRLCDRATAMRPAGAPVFWTLGANQSGKAAIVAWRDFIIPNLDRLVLWPFAGHIADLAGCGKTIVAETYPADALRQLELKLVGSKRRHADRVAFATDLRTRVGMMATPDLARAIAAGFGPDAAGEDRLDCVLGVLCAIAVVEGRQPDFVPDDPWIHRWEGWVLGQTALPS